MSDYEDQELLYLYHVGSSQALNILLLKYQRKIESYVKAHILETPYLSHDDFTQEIWIAVYEAIDKYRHQGDATFWTFFYKVLTRALNTRKKSFYSSKNKAQYNAISYDSPFNNEITCDDFVKTLDIQYLPDQILLINETKEEYHRCIEQRCSQFEKEIVYYHMEGYSYDEISKLLNVDIKSIYNAVYRVNKKVNK